MLHRSGFIRFQHVYGDARPRARCLSYQVRFIFSHGGGTFPFLIERFDRLAKNPKFAARLPRGLRHELTRFYYDTAQASNPGAMSSLKHLVPWSQILFGTDYPYRRASEYLGALEACGFSPGEIEDIHRQNAERLIGALLPGT